MCIHLFYALFPSCHMDILYQLKTVRPMGLSILSSSEKRSSSSRDFCDWNTMIESDKGTTKARIDLNKINLLVPSSNISTVNSIESTEIKEETSKSLASHAM